MTMKDSLAFSRVRQRGCFFLDLAPAEAFKLFTATGERLWVPGWEPTILGSPPQQPGLVFLTGTGPDATIWTVVKSDPVSGQVCYSRVTPESRAGLVQVSIVAVDQGSEVQVEYDLTALSAEGAASLVPYSNSNFSRMMDDWRSLIVDMLANAQPNLAALVV